VEKNYVFAGPRGKVTLADLFEGRSQLVVYHFMFAPDWEKGAAVVRFGPTVVNAMVCTLIIVMSRWWRLARSNRKAGSV